MRSERVQGRLALVVPESDDLLERAFTKGESATGQTSQLLRLLDCMA